MPDYVFAFHVLCWNQGPFLSQYHTLELKVIPSSAIMVKPFVAGNWPVVLAEWQPLYRDIHVSITRRVADPQSRGNHWCEAMAKPCASPCKCRHSRSKRRFSDGASTLFATLGRRWHLPPACWLKSRRLPRPRVLIRGSCAIGAALQRCLTSHSCHILNPNVMLKPLMRSHCKAMCYRKLARYFGRVTAIGDIHVLEWLRVLFRIRRSSSIMLKRMMRSHCKAMCLCTWSTFRLSGEY